MKKLIRTLAMCSVMSLGGATANAQYMIHIAGNNSHGHNGDSSKALVASFRSPMSVCKDSKNNLYVGDGGPIGYMNDACVRKIDDTGIITTIIGQPYATDNALNTAKTGLAINTKLQGVAGLCIDKKGNLLIADGVSTVLRVNLKNDSVTVVAGTRGQTGYAGDGWAADSAKMNSPYDVAVDNDNNIYIAELGNNIIRFVSASNGKIYTYAGIKGVFGLSGDGGPARYAKLDQPRGICVDASNNLFIADYKNHRVRVVNPAGIITTFAGTNMGFGGDGGPANAAMLNNPVRVSADRQGNVYIADASNQRVRKVAAGTGIITTYAGKGDFFTGPDVIGDDGPATAALIVPYGLHADTCGNLFIGSTLFNLRAVTPTKPVKGIICGARIASAPSVTAFAEGNFSVSPNPGTGLFTFQLTTPLSQEAQITVTDVAGRVVKQISTATNRSISLHLNEAPGMYFIQATTSNGRWSEKLIIQ